jgi:Zn2+/Cd2+-exporting ATPase
MNHSTETTQHALCCPDHEQLTEKQINVRLNIALYAGILLLTGFITERSGNTIAAVIFEFIAGGLLIGPIFKDSIKALRNGRVTFPCLVALAFLACIAKGDFLTAGLVAFFMTLADQLENRTAIGANKAIEELIQATPNIVHKELNGDVSDVPVEQIQINDIVQIRPGENAAFDGILINGESTFDESSITGESLPVDKSIDSKVFAGTSNLTGLIKIKVLQIGEDTTVGKVKSLILSAASSKSSTMSTIEESASWYTPAIIMFAAMVYFYNRGSEDSLDKAISILIMACPCSLVLATPSVMIAAITSAAKAGILIKNAVELEFFHRIKHIFFDKTGTLTVGAMELAHFDIHNSFDKVKVLKIAGSLCRSSNHPVARGVYSSLEKANITPMKIASLEEIHGKGLRGVIDNTEYYIGRPEWVCEMTNKELSEVKNNNSVRMIIGNREEGLIASFFLEDQLRDDANTCVEELRKNGIDSITLLTGDNWEPARKVGLQLKLDSVYAKCLPKDKLKQLSDIKEMGHRTAVVGDGINDAPVLAAGDVGIAMGALGSQVAIESASIALMGNSLNRLPFLQTLSKRSQVTIWINIILSISVLVSGLLLSVLGYVSPVMAALIHNFSALLILLNSARLVKLKPNE